MVGEACSRDCGRRILMLIWWHTDFVKIGANISVLNQLVLSNLLPVPVVNAPLQIALTI